MPTLRIDGREITVDEGLNIIQAAEEAGIEVPHYCYHPGLSVSGNCRMCLVELENVPKLQIGCNTLVAEGMVVSTASEKAKEAQAAVLEFLLINHPIDCPVCDQAGECKLQDYYMAYGGYKSKIELETKVNKGKVVDLGPEVVLDEERCILCARCTRFCDEVTKTGELGIFGRGDHSRISLFPGKSLDNPYSANVVDVCPVGALTSKDFRFKSRVWYLEKTPSACTSCATGCNIDIYHRGTEIFRFRPRHNKEVNDFWMCDEGRRSYKSFQRETRIPSPLLREGTTFSVSSWESAVGRVSEIIRTAREEGGAETVAAIAGAKATNEEAFLLSRIITEQVGSEYVAGVSWSPPDAFHDDFLIDADKNPNTQGLKSLGLLSGDDRAASVLSAAENGTIKVLVVFGVDLLTVYGRARIERAVSKTKVIVLDTDYNDFTEYSDIILPIAAAPETEGTCTNKRGRVQLLAPALPPPGEAKTGWEALNLLSGQLDGQGFGSASEIFEELTQLIPAFAGLSYGKIGMDGAALSKV